MKDHVRPESNNRRFLLPNPGIFVRLSTSTCAKGFEAYFRLPLPPKPVMLEDLEELMTHPEELVTLFSERMA